MGCTGSKEKKKVNNTSLTQSSSSSSSNETSNDEIKPELSVSIIDNLLNKTKFTQQRNTRLVEWIFS